MQKKVVTFKFPADAWDGILEAWSQGHEVYVVRFEEDGTRKTIDNPQTKEEFAIDGIKKAISERWKNKERQEANQAANEQINAQLQAREEEVLKDTEVTVEDIEE